MMIIIQLSMDSIFPPSIASGSQVCRPNWADFPMAASKNSNPIRVRTVSFMQGDKLYTVAQSRLPKVQKTPKKATLRNISPTRLTTMALMADLLACIRVNQKLISKYEETPIPSQPTNKIKQFSPATRINMKNVNIDKYEKKRWL